MVELVKTFAASLIDLYVEQKSLLIHGHSKHLDVAFFVPFSYEVPFAIVGALIHSTDAILKKLFAGGIKEVSLTIHCFSLQFIHS